MLGIRCHPKVGVNSNNMEKINNRKNNHGKNFRDFENVHHEFQSILSGTRYSIYVVLLGIGFNN